MDNKKCRAFLKWAGGKYALVNEIRSRLPTGQRLIEPFVGAGSVFLNTQYSDYLLNDINPDLINLYTELQLRPDQYIIDAKGFFAPEFNQAETYYRLRDEFNQSSDPYHRSLLFLYLNRHGYNGLCRYNLSGKFNVPFGRYKQPYFPEAELNYFAEKAQYATFTCLPFSEVFAMAGEGDVIYCDPPYAPISKTSNFTSYATNGFSMDEQKQLAVQARLIVKSANIPVLISNHDTEQTREIYQGANLSELKVGRYISQKGHKRKKVDELLALFHQPVNQKHQTYDKDRHK
ncbi:Dam family site-specific DNA-(adenine-N6)-methyltransferase [Bowmanella sp. Y26]|uniref:Dam family site-specific DNA-(adenine-N6)-methyltransferase n=1 Tax=Bowmanella yangjiangensis TaxID=2811230 RepID=UPI001BDC7760|nr:Dam family site-specific DNA-(adenine-N6)-methyltransferase [Bowmanella yangjiangensis]MBT1064261.1 Dam family site-specific DNA-(adenine-N6)-methyltransferase [Bowmanella yangjiangensis]